MKTITFVGDKPSKKNKSDNVPFVGTQSYKRLLTWIWHMNIDITRVKLMNRSRPTPIFLAYQMTGEDFFKNEVDKSLYVALGNKAANFLNKYSIEHFKLPHPSGRNLKLNDAKWLDNELKKCEDWVNDV